MKMKKLMVAALAAVITVGSALPASAAWVQSGSEWRYQNEDGSWQANKWFQEAGQWYHFDANGNAQKGWLKDTDGKWYFFAYNGIMQTGLIKVDEKVYYMNADGSLFSGKMKVGTVEYDFTEYGTTNGTPSVGRTQTFGGNGNQVITGGGSGSSGTSTNVVKNNVLTAVKAIVDENADNGFVNLDGQTSITVTVKDGQMETELRDALNTAGEVLSDIIKIPDVKSVQFEGESIDPQKSITDQIKDLAINKKHLTGDKSLGSIINEKYNVTVVLSDGQSINYSISIKK
jgi:hypothetical protein